MAFRAQPTTYAGQRFRSALEARWALFFNHLGIWWIYEPQKFTTSEGGYIPDFYLPSLDFYVEVKGTEWALGRAFDRYCRFVEEHDASLLVLGPVPDVGTGRMAVHFAAYPVGDEADCGGVAWSWQDQDRQWSLLPLLNGRGLTVETKFISGLSHDPTVQEAYERARTVDFRTLVTV